MAVAFDFITSKTVPGAQALANPGHVARTNTTFGTGFSPLTFHGLAVDEALKNGGHVVRDDHYARFPAMNEWKGVPSARAL